MPTPSTADPRLPLAADTKSKPSANKRPLSEAAVRALAEAAVRQIERGKVEPERSQAANEIRGRGGLDPTRYGDWEVNGLASDF
jgi:hypothetical protein